MVEDETLFPLQLSVSLLIVESYLSNLDDPEPNCGDCSASRISIEIDLFFAPHEDIE